MCIACVDILGYVIRFNYMYAIPVPGFCKSDKSFLVADCFTKLCKSILVFPDSKISRGKPKTTQIVKASSLYNYFFCTRTWYSICKPNHISWPSMNAATEIPDQSLCHCGPLLHISFRYHIPGQVNLHHWNCIEFFDHLQKNFFENNKHFLVKFGWICVWQLQRHDRKQLRCVQNQGDDAVCVWLCMCQPPSKLANLCVNAGIKTQQVHQAFLNEIAELGEVCKSPPWSQHFDPT